jgi:hypothetical protein
MIPVAKEYGRGFFSRRYKLSWRAPHVINAIEKTFNLDARTEVDYIDVGCAIGDLVQEGLRRGWDSYGIEGSEAALPFLECPPDRVYFGDLRQSVHKYMIARRFTVLSCFEVAEHIQEEYSDMFVKNLCNLSYNIVVSAAPPGQKGHHHYNCQSYEYWDKKFEDMEYVKETMLEDRFRSYLEPWRKKDGIRAFYQNCLIYRKRWDNGNI